MTLINQELKVEMIGTFMFSFSCQKDNFLQENMEIFSMEVSISNWVTKQQRRSMRAANALTSNRVITRNWSFNRKKIGA